MKTKQLVTSRIISKIVEAPLPKYHFPAVDDHFHSKFRVMESLKTPTTGLIAAFFAHKQTRSVNYGVSSKIRRNMRTGSAILKKRAVDDERDLTETFTM